MPWIKILLTLAGLALIGSALFTLAVLWPFVLIIYGLIFGGFLIKLATEI